MDRSTIESLTTVLLFTGDFVPSDFVPRSSHVYYMIAGREDDFPEKDLLDLSVDLWRAQQDVGSCNHASSCRYLRTKFPSNPPAVDLPRFRSLGTDLNLLGINILLRLSSQKSFAWGQFYYDASGVRSQFFQNGVYSK